VSSAVVRKGKAGRARGPGLAARRLAPLLLGGAVLLALLAAERFWHDRDLREIAGLGRTTAVVVRVEDNRRWSDEVEVRFRADQREVSASIPSSAGPRVGDAVEVAYVRADPERVRTVSGWAPAFESWLTQGAVLAVFGVAIGAFGVASRASGSRYEADGRGLPEPRVEALGVRVVRGSLFLQGVFVVLALLSSAPLFYTGAVQAGDQENLAGGALVLLLLLAVALGFHLYWGRDGVWATPEELIARRRGRLRRWPWAQVHELGVVVDRERATVAAARVDDGDQDGIGVEGWVTLARPTSGPLAAHRWKTHFQDLAAQQHLPFTDGLRSSDLADSLSSTYIPGRGAVG
jgi:hypothetical protein